MSLGNTVIVDNVYANDLYKDLWGDLLGALEFDLTYSLRTRLSLESTLWVMHQTLCRGLGADP